MRTITDHIVNGDPVAQLQVSAIDEPGAGGANHDYRIQATYQKGSSRVPIQSHMDDAVIQIGSNGETTITLGRIKFQNGPIKEVGVNGLTQEAILAVVIDRLRSFQAGPFACNENSAALKLCEAALEVLQSRTKARMARGVEGTNQQ